MGEDQLGEIVSLMFMAIAVSMDAFSISLGLGMQIVRLKRILIIGLVFGLFHIMFPFIGMVLGKILSDRIGELTTLAGGLLLVAIGAHMFFTVFTYKTNTGNITQPFGLGLIILATTVSIDSFSVGLSIGISGTQTVIALLLFGSAGVVLTWSGFLLARKVRGFFGAYSELLGGSILIALGLKMIFG